MDKNILKNLNWNITLESQEKAINEIASMIDLNPKNLLQPLGKEYWKNAAKVLCKMGYPKIKEAIPGLFIWLQDMNWPGAIIVLQIIKELPKNVTIQYLECAVAEALSTEDEIWLANLSVFLTHCDLKEDDFVSKEAYLVLVDADEV